MDAEDAKGVRRTKLRGSLASTSFFFGHEGPCKNKYLCDGGRLTMASNQQERSVYLRAIRHYLAAILVSAILLLSFSLASLRFQKQSVNEVTPANLHFRGERLAFEIEAEILRLAGNCLRDLERLTANTSLDSERNPYTTADLMQELELFRDSHRIARRFFVLENGEVLFPPVRRFAPNPSRLAATNKEDLSHRRFERLFAEAENHEVREDGLEQALSGYRKCYELDVPESLKALALDQMAECLVKLGRPMEAARTYHRLGNYYADHYDKHWVPYKIVSGLALDAIQGGERSPLPQRLVDLHQELTRGRWALDAEQYEAVTSHIEKRLGKEASVLEGGHLLDILSFGRAVQGASALEEIADPVRVYSNTILEDDAHYEVFCRAVSDGHQTNKKVIGFSLDIDWLTRYFVPEKQKSIVPDGTSVPFALALKSTLDGDSDELLHSDLRIPFPSILSLWELKLSEGAAAAWKAGIFREMFFVGGRCLDDTMYSYTGEHSRDPNNERNALVAGAVRFSGPDLSRAQDAAGHNKTVCRVVVRRAIGPGTAEMSAVDHI